MVLIVSFVFLESYLSVMDELLYSPGIEVVTCRHEGGAGFMAVADAKCTGKAGVAFVSRGPGATNASISVHSRIKAGAYGFVYWSSQSY